MMIRKYPPQNSSSKQPLGLASPPNNIDDVSVETNEYGGGDKSNENLLENMSNHQIEKNEKFFTKHVDRYTQAYNKQHIEKGKGTPRRANKQKFASQQILNLTSSPSNSKLDSISTLEDWDKHENDDVEERIIFEIEEADNAYNFNFTPNTYDQDAACEQMSCGNENDGGVGDGT